MPLVLIPVLIFLVYLGKGCLLLTSLSTPEKTFFNILYDFLTTHMRQNKFLLQGQKVTFLKHFTVPRKMYYQMLFKWKSVVVWRTSQYLELGRSQIDRMKMDPFVGFLSMKWHTIRLLSKQNDISIRIFHTPMGRICVMIYPPTPRRPVLPTLTSSGARSFLPEIYLCFLSFHPSNPPFLSPSLLSFKVQIKKSQLLLWRSGLRIWPVAALVSAEVQVWSLAQYSGLKDPVLRRSHLQYRFNS